MKKKKDEGPPFASTGPKRLSVREQKAIEMSNRGASLESIVRGLGLPVWAAADLVGFDRDANPAEYARAAAAGRTSLLDNPARPTRDEFIREDDLYSNPYVRRSS